MDTTNPENERIKRAYFEWCRDAEGLSPKTIDHAGRAIRAYERFIGYQSFKTFSARQVMAFRKHMATEPSATTGRPLSIATRNAMLVLLRSFFTWLSSRPGYRQRVNVADVGFLSLDRSERTIALHRGEPKPFPNCEQIVQVLRGHPTATDLDRRDQAIIAFLLLTCARVGSIASLKLKHIDLEQQVADFPAEEVRTKGSKSFKVWFFPVDPMVESIVAAWVHHLRSNLGFTDSDPLFPATAQSVGERMQFTNDGLSRFHWKCTDSIRTIVKRRLTAAGQPYYHPHLFRKTLGRFGEQLCRNPEELKAWSQNMAHNSVMTTLLSYGQVPALRQAELIRGLAKPSGINRPVVSPFEKVRKFLDDLERNGDE